MTRKTREPVGCTQIATLPLYGQASRQRHIAETDANEIVVLETGAGRDAPDVRAGPFTLPQALELAEQVLAGSPRHITHALTPMILGAALIAVEAAVRGLHPPAKPRQETGE